MDLVNKRADTDIKVPIIPSSRNPFFIPGVKETPVEIKQIYNKNAANLSGEKKVPKALLKARKSLSYLEMLESCGVSDIILSVLLNPKKY